MGQVVLNKDSEEVKRFIETLEKISSFLEEKSLIYLSLIHISEPTRH